MKHNDGNMRKKVAANWCTVYIDGRLFLKIFRITIDIADGLWNKCSYIAYRLAQGDEPNRINSRDDRAS